MTRFGEVAASTRCGQSASGSSSVLVRLNVALSVEHSGVMAESTDQRIKNILQKKAKEKEAAEQAKKQAQERSNERQATAENVRTGRIH
jgi:hypothetical protein